MSINDNLTPDQLAEIEAARLAEIARVEALEARYEAIQDPHLAVHLAGLNYSNPALILKEAIESNDDSNLVLLEQQAQACNNVKDQQEINAQALKLLRDTDYKVVRHYEQKLANIQCSLSDEDFAQLMIDRQAARDSIV